MTNHIPFVRGVSSFYGGRAMQMILLAIGLLPALVGDSHAQFTGPGPRILLHIAPVTAKNPCTPALVHCQDAVVKGTLGDHFVYLVVARDTVSTIAGMQCGITYDNGCSLDQADGRGIDIFQWVLCGTLEFPTSGSHGWPAPGTGNIVTWDYTARCQTGEVAIAGYFYVSAYSRASLYVTPRPVDGLAKVADCNTVERDVQENYLGYVTFSSDGQAPGCNPCVPFSCPIVDVFPWAPHRAGTDDFETAALLHVTPANSPIQCSTAGLNSCSEAETSGEILGPGTENAHHYVYLLAASHVGTVGRLTCGITYDGGNPLGRDDGHRIDISSWTSCASSQAPADGWPAPGGSNTFAMAAVTRDLTVAGYFYLSSYAADTLRVSPQAGNTTSSITTCDGTVHELTQANLGTAIFSPGATLTGCNPCVKSCDAVSPVVPTTWSGVKSLYR